MKPGGPPQSSCPRSRLHISTHLDQGYPWGSHPAQLTSPHLQGMSRFLSTSGSVLSSKPPELGVPLGPLAVLAD